MTLRLNGSTSGYVEIDAPAVAGSNTLVLPNGNGTNGQYLQTNGSGGLSWATVSTSNLTRGTAVTLTNQTSVTFTGIPSTARRVVLILDRMSTVSGGDPVFRIGDSGGIETSGYETIGGRIYGGASSGTTLHYDQDKFRGNWSGGGTFYSGKLELLNTTGNKWVGVGHIYLQENNYNWYSVHSIGGSKELSDTLDRVEFTTNSTAFDSGVLNIFYEV